MSRPVYNPENDTTYGDYEIGEYIIGEGSFGRVFPCRKKIENVKIRM